MCLNFEGNTELKSESHTYTHTLHISPIASQLVLFYRWLTRPSALQPPVRLYNWDNIKHLPVTRAFGNMAAAVTGWLP